MAKVQGMQEKLHSPLYDAFFVKAGTKFKDSMTDPRVIRFFVDIQNKTKLETNLQASGVLPSLNKFEARALRVAVSNLRTEEPTGGGASKSRGNESAILADLIYNSVTSLIVGEKIMIEVPTFWFPAGAGVSPGLNVSNHGEPDPSATFRFAEPVCIEAHQGFRVEMAFPQGIPGVNPDEIQKLAHVTGPLRIWVVLDGYLTRDVQ